MGNPEKKENIIMAVMIFVIDSGKNVLLLKRVDNNQWEPIKGGINIGETWLNATLRELKEETGFIPQTMPELIAIVNDEIDTEQGSKTKIKGYVSYCYISGIEPIPILNGDNEFEHNNFKWISIKKIEREKIYPPIANNLIVEIKKKLF